MTLPDINTIRTLPCYHHEPVSEEYLDALGHMSFPYYPIVISRAWWRFMEEIGCGEEYAKTHSRGIFALENHFHFLGELKLGEEMGVYLRLIDLTPKRFHYIKFLVNETQGAVATTSEGVSSFANLSTRRTAPFPAEIFDKIDRLRRQHATLEWAPSLCGVIKA